MNVLKFPKRGNGKSDTRIFDGVYKQARTEHKTLCFHEMDGRIPDEFMNDLIMLWRELYGVRS